jgi:hypothetical protein
LITFPRVHYGEQLSSHLKEGILTRAQELSDTNITVTAFMPGVIETEFAQTSGMEEIRLYDTTYSARKVAEEGYNAMLADKLNIFAGVTMVQRLMVSLLPLIPKKLQLKLVRWMQEV